MSNRIFEMIPYVLDLVEQIFGGGNINTELKVTTDNEKYLVLYNKVIVTSY